MAQETNVVVLDDLAHGSGDEVLADETVEFAIDGKPYEIDLSEDNAAKLREVLAPYVAAGRRTLARGRRGSVAAGRSTARTRSTAENAKIRQWALEQKMDVSERGRIPGVVVEAYEKANA